MAFLEPAPGGDGVEAGASRPQVPGWSCHLPGSRAVLSGRSVEAEFVLRNPERSVNAAVEVDGKQHSDALVGGAKRPVQCTGMRRCLEVPGERRYPFVLGGARYPAIQTAGSVVHDKNHDRFLRSDGKECI